jgi:carboxymethylenebutenolidase
MAGYYGGAIVRFADDKPKVPTQLHFGEKDAGIPLTDVEAIRAKRRDVDRMAAQPGFLRQVPESLEPAFADEDGIAGTDRSAERDDGAAGA